MKTQNVVLILITFCFCINASAQFSFGLKGSYHNAWQEYGDDFAGNGGSDLKIKGFSTSLMAYFALGKNVEIGVEPGYIRRGAACEPGFFINNPYLNGDATLFANYLTAPVYLKGKLPLLKNRIELLGKCGGGPSYLIDGYREVNLSWGPAVTQVIDIDFREETDLRRWDAGLNAGIGVGIHLGPGTLLMEYEYYHSLKDMNELLTSRNRNRGFALGYLVRI